MFSWLDLEVDKVHFIFSIIMDKVADNLSLSLSWVVLFSVSLFYFYFILFYNLGLV